MSTPIRIATRASPLAREQARRVAARLEAGSTRDVVTVVVETTGDRRRDVPIEVIGGQGAFSVEVDRAVAEGRADLAVHSAKDLPSFLGPAEASLPPR